MRMLDQELLDLIAALRASGIRFTLRSQEFLEVPARARTPLRRGASFAQAETVARGSRAQGKERHAMTAQEVLGLRTNLLRAGYTPIPLYGKAPPVYGKNNSRKGLGGWQNLEDVSPEQLEMWARTWPDALNTGILTRAVPTFDADILNEDAARAVEDLVREHYEERGHILVRIGRPPKRAFLFRTEEPFSKTRRQLRCPQWRREREARIPR